MKVLGIDFETQGSDATTTNITEVAAILMEWGPEPRELKRFSSLCYEPTYPPQTKEIVELTGITDAKLKEFGQPLLCIDESLFEILDIANIIVAHNKSFDQIVYESNFSIDLDTPWICTLTDIPYAPKYTCKKLSHLCLDHGIAIEPKKLHRSDYDVELMLTLLAQYDINDVLAYSREPSIYLKANCKAPWVDQGVEKAKAQKLGFNWEVSRHDDRQFPKLWVKKVKQRFLDEEYQKAHAIGLNIERIA